MRKAGPKNPISFAVQVPGVKTSSSSRLGVIRRRLDEGWAPPIAKLLGFRLTKISRGRARIEMEAGPRHANPMGTLHGGVICDIADAAMGMSYASLLKADESFTTIDIKVNFLKPVWTGHLVADARILKKGRTIGLAECRVIDGEKKLVAYATSTCMTLAAGRGDEMTRPRLSVRKG